jgi:putative acetyltransferase
LSGRSAIIIRDQTEADRQAVYDVVAAAFNQTLEAELVEALGDAGDAALSLVAEHDRRIIGHIALSKMEAPFPALALAPLSVRPGKQRMGVGSWLVQEALSRAQASEWAAIFVLGSPNYYQRFGFSVEAAKGFLSPYAGDHFMVLRLAQALPTTGELRHAPAFAALH